MAAIPDTARASDLYERYAPRIFGYCLHRLGSREEAEDALQTTFLNAFRGLSRGVVPESESAWLFKIAENVCLSRHRASFRRRRVESPADLRLVEETVAAPAGPEDELIPLEDALADMPETQRRALLLREWQGLSYREIAAELEVSQSAVETLIFRARRSLARRLEAPRERLRRAGRAVDVGSVLGALKGAFTTGAAVKAVLAGAAVTGLALGVAVDRPQPRRHDATPPAAPVRQASAPAISRPVARAPRVAEPVARDVVRESASTQKPVARPKPVVHTRPARHPRPTARPERVSATSPVVVPPAPPTPSSAEARPAKPHEQQANNRPAPKPSGAKHQRPKAHDQHEPGPPQDAAEPGNQGGQGQAKGKNRAR
jgi:RNA polymerase sigma factor (sigma-70 family)